MRKTTLARALNGAYFDLEQEPERLRLDLEWPALMASQRLAVLDETRAWPEVFNRLRGAIDSDRRRNGCFLRARFRVALLHGEFVARGNRIDTPGKRRAGLGQCTTNTSKSAPSG
jgi:hypothetical protein